MFSKVVDGELKRRNVDTSVANLTRVEVTSGLSDNATLRWERLVCSPCAAGCR